MIIKRIDFELPFTTLSVTDSDGTFESLMVAVFARIEVTKLTKT